MYSARSIPHKIIM